MSISSSGDVHFTDENRRAVMPLRMDRSLYYQREKGPKIQNRVHIENGVSSVGGVKELTFYDSVIVIDTNTANDDKNLSVSCFLHCKFIEGIDERVWISCESTQINWLELHNPLGNPELLAILKVALCISEWPEFRVEDKIAIVTDTELRSHSAINDRTMPLWGQYMLPKGFSLHYASADTGRDALNQLMRLCDKLATEQMERIRNGRLPVQTVLGVLEEDNRIQIGFSSVLGLEIENPVFEGLRLAAGVEFKLHELKST